MKSWLIAHANAFERAAKRLIGQPAGTLLSVWVISIAIVLPFGLFILFANISAAAGRFNTDPNINVYMALNATDKEIKEVEKKLGGLAQIASVRAISREAALAEMKRIANIADLLASLDSNPLPHSFAIKPKSSDLSVLTDLRREIAALPKVEQVVMDFEWAQKLKRFATFAERLTMLLGAILALAVAFVTGNTIRLQILTQKDEIEVSQLIGATRRFIRRPFLYFGAIQGFLAGLTAVLLVFGLIHWAGREVAALTASYGSDFALEAPQWSQCLWVLASATALGWAGAFLSVWLYLRGADRR